MLAREDHGAASPRKAQFTIRTLLEALASKPGEPPCRVSPSSVTFSEP